MDYRELDSRELDSRELDLVMAWKVAARSGEELIPESLLATLWEWVWQGQR
jgi:hypothetical protein